MSHKHAARQALNTAYLFNYYVQLKLVIPLQHRTPVCPG